MRKPTAISAEGEAQGGESALRANDQRLLELLDELYELEQFRHEQLKLRKLAGYLKSSRTRDEIYAAMGCFGPDLWPEAAGALYLLHGNDEYLQRVAAWGPEITARSIMSRDCWALRLAQPHLVWEATSGLRCPHALHTECLPSLCIPLIAQGRVLGVFHLQGMKVGCTAPGNATVAGCGIDAAVMSAQEVGFALANLGLQDSLREQVMRDPLTGLFNRQFFEELLVREMARAERKTHQLSVIVLDIDHFKQINDTFGHSAGDAVLRHIGPVLQSHVRGSDVACRIGGEEFLLLLSELALPVAIQRAEAIRNALRQISIRFGDRVLDPITASFGAAAYPHHGRTVEALFRAADQALLDAKRAGRDRVVAARLPT